MYRGTWGVKGVEGVPFLYFAHLARLAENHFGYKGITAVQHGHGGWTAAQALKVVDKEVVDEAGPNDLVMLQFGGNDMSWAGVTPTAWKSDMKKLIARVKTKTDQIVLMSTTPIGGIGKLQPSITKVLQELVRQRQSRCRGSRLALAPPGSAGPAWTRKRSRSTPSLPRLMP
jgi:lysophospholipase L1-like esterase